MRAGTGHYACCGFKSRAEPGRLAGQKIAPLRLSRRVLDNAHLRPPFGSLARVRRRSLARRTCASACCTGHMRALGLADERRPGVTTYRLMTDTGTAFELVLDDTRRITDVAGPWPSEEGAEFELRGELPAHAQIADAPPHILEFAAAQGRDVCMYDPVGCRTCFCDENGRILYCRKMC